MTWPPIETADGRRAWAFAAIVGGCAVFTGFAACGVFPVRKSPGLTFWLALAAHAQILVGMTALAALFVRRSIKLGRDRIEIDDKGEVE